MPFDNAWVQQRLPGRIIEWHSSIDSTMGAAERLAESGCATGSAVVADHQTAGVGRLQRPWYSEPESGLYVSVVLRLRLAPDVLPLVTMALGLATATAISKTTGLSCDLRWPNDVLIQDRKCAGILTLLVASAVIAGIGVNVNHSSFPPELGDIATSLRIVRGGPQSREELLVELLPAIDSLCAILQEKGKQPILDMFSDASSYVRGRQVSVDQGDSVLEGTTAGLTPSGFLIVRDRIGKENVIVSGGIRPCS